MWQAHFVDQSCEIWHGFAKSLTDELCELLSRHGAPTALTANESCEISRQMIYLLLYHTTYKNMSMIHYLDRWSRWCDSSSDSSQLETDPFSTNGLKRESVSFCFPTRKWKCKFKMNPTMSERIGKPRDDDDGLHVWCHCTIPYPPDFWWNVLPAIL